MDSQKVKTWSGKIFRHFLVFLLAVIAVMFIIMKFVLPDFQKKITNQSGTITNITTLMEEKHSLFNTKNDLLWGWFSVKIGVGKPVREKLNGEQGK